MIYGVYTVEPIRAEDIQGVVQVMGKCGQTFLLERDGDMFASIVPLRVLETGQVMPVHKSRTFDRVTNIESWDNMSDDARMDIELDLMTRGL